MSPNLQVPQHQTPETPQRNTAPSAAPDADIFCKYRVWRLLDAMQMPIDDLGTGFQGCLGEPMAARLNALCTKIQDIKNDLEDEIVCHTPATKAGLHAQLRFVWRFGEGDVREDKFSNERQHYRNLTTFLLSEVTPDERDEYAALIEKFQAARNLAVPMDKGKRKQALEEIAEAMIAAGATVWPDENAMRLELAATMLKAESEVAPNGQEPWARLLRAAIEAADWTALDQKLPGEPDWYQAKHELA